MASAIYQRTHHLLCHDDELEGRRIAYVLYLVPGSQLLCRHGAPCAGHPHRRAHAHRGLVGRGRWGARPVRLRQGAKAQPTQRCITTRVTGQGDPTVPVTSLVPKWNSFVFFEVHQLLAHSLRRQRAIAQVSPVSFHQVSEVLSKKTRLSIHGWYHGKPFEVRAMRPLRSGVGSVPSTHAAARRGA